MIEINAGGKQIFKTYYETSMKVTINETYGELKVTDKQNNALPQIYVKVFY